MKKYNEITEYAFKMNYNLLNEGYIKFFIYDNWLIKVLQKDDKFVLERKMIDLSNDSNPYLMLDIICNCSGFDYYLICDSIEDVYKVLDNGLDFWNKNDSIDLEK